MTDYLSMNVVEIIMASELILSKFEAKAEWNQL